MCKKMFILLLFPCCFAQGGTIFDPDDNIQGAEIKDLSSFMSFITRKLSTVPMTFFKKFPTWQKT